MGVSGDLDPRASPIDPNPTAPNSPDDLGQPGEDDELRRGMSQLMVTFMKEHCPEFIRIQHHIEILGAEDPRLAEAGHQCDAVSRHKADALAREPRWASEPL